MTTEREPPPVNVEIFAGDRRTITAPAETEREPLTDAEIDALIITALEVGDPDYMGQFPLGYIPNEHERRSAMVLYAAGHTAAIAESAQEIAELRAIIKQHESSSGPNYYQLRERAEKAEAERDALRADAELLRKALLHAINTSEHRPRTCEDCAEAERLAYKHQARASTPEGAKP